MKGPEPIVLASQSPRRRKMMEDVGIPFQVIPAGIDEIRGEDEPPAAFALRAARDKGEHVAAALNADGRHPWIVSADTIVVLGDEVLVKPTDEADARAKLSALSGNTHTVITGWAVGRHGGPWITERSETRVTFHLLTPEQILGYAATGEGMDKAGAYAIQGLGTFLVDRIEGDYFNVVGLPISRVVRALLQVGAITRFPLT